VESGETKNIPGNPLDSRDQALFSESHLYKKNQQGRSVQHRSAVVKAEFRYQRFHGFPLSSMDIFSHKPSREGKVNSSLLAASMFTL